MRESVACPACTSGDTRVVATGASRVFAQATQRRRRHCRACGKRFTTYEIPAARMGVVAEMWRAKGDQWRIR